MLLTGEERCGRREGNNTLIYGRRAGRGRHYLLPGGSSVPEGQVHAPGVTRYCVDQYIGWAKYTLANTVLSTVSYRALTKQTVYRCLSNGH